MLSLKSFPLRINLCGDPISRVQDSKSFGGEGGHIDHIVSKIVAGFAGQCESNCFRTEKPQGLKRKERL